MALSSSACDWMLSRDGTTWASAGWANKATSGTSNRILGKAEAIFIEKSFPRVSHCIARYAASTANVPWIPSDAYLVRVVTNLFYFKYDRLTAWNFTARLINEIRTS